MGGNQDKIKGRVKQAAGDLLGDEELQREGETDETAGRAKQAVEKAEEKVEGAIDDVTEKLT